ncbi:MAG: DUF4302 domain-containing protein [Prevotella sp.]|nr:DUF4302 domain-containing protein [Prevotella sp.]
MFTKYLKLSLLALIACCGFVATLTGCQMKEDDLFDQDPANRSDAWMADYRRVFNNNQYGWALYTMNPTYGRHPSVQTYAVRFDQVNSTFYKSISTVRMPGVADKDSLVSMYSFKMDNGIVLSFDTYNGFFHYYADQSQYFAQDLQGDFEFCLDRYSENEDTIFGRGKTKQLPFVMIKLPVTAPEYQAACDSIQSFYSPYNCSFVCEGDTLPARFLGTYQNLSIWMDDDDPRLDGHLYSYGNLVGGLYFLEPIEYKGHIIKEMKITAEKDGYEDIHGQARIIPKPFANYWIYDEENDSRFFGYSALGTWTQAEWDKARNAINKSGKQKADDLHYITLATDGFGGLDLIINSWFGSDEVHYPMEMKKMSNDEIAVKWTGKETSGRSYKFYDIGYKYIVDAFASKDEWRTYKISARSGSVMSPGEFQLTEESNPDNSIYFPTNFRYYHYSIWE